MEQAPLLTALPQDGREHRLHPLSWLFVLIAQLKQFIVPLLVLLVAGRGDRNDLWGLIAAAVLVATSLAQYFTYRYRLGADAIVIRSGWLHRSLREIPYARIHNVDLQQSLLHRLVGVAEVRLESAGGAKPEAQMRVLTMAQAQALEALVRGHGASPGDARGDSSTAAPLLTLPPAELVRLGLVSNRGLILVAAAFGALAQAGGDLLETLFEHWGRWLFGWLTEQIGGHAHDSPLVLTLAAISLALTVLFLLRLLSIVLAFLHFYDFSLREDDGRIQVERGLLARSRASAKRRRIQSWTLREGILQRWLGRRSLQVETAGGPRGQQPGQQVLKELAPIATPSACNALLARLLPQAHWPALDWQPLHPRAWLKLALPGLLLIALLVLPACWRFGPPGLLVLLLAPLQLWRARRLADACGWADNGAVVAWRAGWLDKRWSLAEIDKLQAVRLSQSPLQRRFGMADLLLDTAGASPFGAPLQLRQLPLEAAQALSARLLSRMARKRLRW